MKNFHTCPKCYAICTDEDRLDPLNTLSNTVSLQCPCCGHAFKSDTVRNAETQQETLPRSNEDTMPAYDRGILNRDVFCMAIDLWLGTVAVTQREGQSIAGGYAETCAFNIARREYLKRIARDV